MQQGVSEAEELKESQEKALSQASELHGKEVHGLRDELDKLKQELSSSKDRGRKLEKLVSEVQAYKDKLQVRTGSGFWSQVGPPRYALT